MADVAHGPYDEILFDQLRDLRKRIASEQGVPAYIVFGDNSLVQMARDKPMDEAGLLDITGVGQHKLDKYGNEFLDAIALYSVEQAGQVP